MNMSLMDVFKIIGELKPLYDSAKGQKLTISQYLDIAEKVIAVLNKYKVTLEDLGSFIEMAKPFLSMIGK